MRDHFFDPYGMRHGFDGRAMREARDRAKRQRGEGANLGDILREATRKPKPVDPSTIEPNPSLGLCEIRAKLIEYEAADLKSLLDFTALEPYGSEGFVVRKKSFETFAGIEKLGSGCYSDVYALDDKRVLKIVKRRDDGYARFVAKIKSEGGDNPHLPKIYYSGVWGGKTVYVLERLTDGDDDIKRLFIKVVANGRSNGPMTGNPFITIAPSILAVARMLDGVCNDLHSGNVMFRGQCPVVTDPTS